MRCPPQDDLWSVECCEDNPLLGFPETAVWVANDGLPAVVADRTRVMFHNPLHPYRRRLLDHRGYSCAFIAMDVEFFQGLAEGLTPGTASRYHSELPGAGARLDGDAFFGKSLLLGHLRSPVPRDRLLIEEVSVGLLDECLAAGWTEALGADWGSADRSPRRTMPPREGTRAGHAALVEALRAELAVSFTENRSLQDLARSVYSSPYHLARVFRRQAGVSIHGYRTELRLRQGLEMIADPEVDLAAVATSLGFANHSHFTTRFSRRFGLPPSSARRLAAGNARSHRELSTFVKAREFRRG
jgi:AraC-like DNA-binding protein